MSLSHVFCDLGRTIFATGQIYVALSRCKTLEGLFLVNFDETNIKVDPLAMNEYVRLKSKPIHDAGITAPINAQSKTTGKKRKTKAKVERIWYNTSAAKKAKSTMSDILNNSKTKASDGSAKNKKNVNKSRKPGSMAAKNTKKANPTLGGTSRLTAANISQFVNRIHEGIPDSFIPTTDIISGGEMLGIFRRALVPCHRNSSRDSFILRTARELDPDPFNNRRSNSLWLSGSTILKYIAILKDNSLEIAGPTIYNMGPYCGSYLSTNQRNRGRLKEFIQSTFSERPFTRTRLDTLNFIITFRNPENPLSNCCRKYFLY